VNSRSFVYTAWPARVLFGEGTFDQVAIEFERMNAKRALVLCTPGQRPLADEIVLRLGPLAGGIFDQARMHVPIETAEAARAMTRELGADGCVAVGGGSTIGVAKAIALTWEASPRSTPSGPLPILAIPTTFAGSEMTPIYGITAHGKKSTGRDPRVLPRTVIYDPKLIMTLPARIAGPSGMNAVAHCVEALYAEDANPITSLMAEEGIRALAGSLRQVVSQVDNLAARADALYGAWLAGTSLGTVKMAIHHRLCHILGGSYNLPHAETHTIILPHALSYNRVAVPDAISRISRALGGIEPAGGLYDLAEALGAPQGLKELGMPAASLDEVAHLATQGPYFNPRPIEYSAIRRLLQDAWDGRRPQST
jgi:maleylacetate reductase